MAAKLRKFKYTGNPATRSNASSDRNANASPGKEGSHLPDSIEMDATDLKTEILLALKADISEVIKSEMKNALTDDFDFIKGELQAVKSEIINNTAVLSAEIDQMRGTIKEVEDGLSVWSNEVTTLKNTVKELRAEMAGLKEKCEDMEGRMRRCNIRIIGVPETPDSCSTASVAKLLAEVLRMDKEPLVDRSHRGLGSNKPGGKPRVIVAKLHYYKDCVEILRRARTQGPLRFNGDPIVIFPDYKASVAKARAAFTDVRKLLRGRQGVRFGILFPACLRVTYKGEDMEFIDPAKAMAYVKENIATSSDGERQ